jgi:hypothetical protein
VAFEERLLGLVSEGDVEAPARCAEAHAEHPALGQGAVEQASPAGAAAEDTMLVERSEDLMLLAAGEWSMSW